MTMFGVRPRVEGSKFFPMARPETPPRPADAYRTPWTEAEVTILREFAGLGSKALAAKLPGRTRRAIRFKAGSLGIRITTPATDRRGIRHMAKRGKLNVGGHTHPLVRAFFDEINRRKMTLKEAEACGFASGTIWCWSKSTTPRIDNFVAALNHVGLDLQIVPRRGPLDDVLERVSFVRRVSVKGVISGDRGAPLVRARDEVSWLAKKHLGLSYPAIAKHLGERDHTTILAAVRRHQARLDALRAKRRGG